MLEDDEELRSHQGHDPHFLSRLERVSLPHVELAMSLYRDPELLRYILDSARVAQGAERAAIALADGGAGPFLVVARDGHFVTCLGEGMSPGALPIISRGQLDALSDKIATLRERMELARSLGGGRVGRLLRRLFEAGQALSQEEFLAVSVWQQMLGRELHGWIVDAAQQAAHLRHELRRVDKLGPRDAPELRRFWNAIWAIGHLTLLHAPGMRDAMASWPAELEAAKAALSWRAMRSGVVGIALRGAWAAGCLGKGALAPYKAALAEAKTPMQLLDKGTALVAIAARTGALRAEVAKALRRPHAPLLSDPSGEWARAIRDFFAEIVDASGETTDPLSKIANELYGSFYREAAEGTAAPQFADPAEVPANLARATVATFGAPFMMDLHRLQPILLAVPWLARAEPEELYYPKAIADEVLIPWSPGESIAVLHAHHGFYGPKTPARAVKTPGRNEPCPCGSGKKYKKCCGAGGVRPEG